MRLIGAMATHRYEDLADRRVYVIPQGEIREVPDQVASLLVGAHPDKVYYADVPATRPGGPGPRPAVGDRNVGSPASRGGAESRRPPRRQRPPTGSRPNGSRLKKKRKS